MSGNLPAIRAGALLEDTPERVEEAIRLDPAAFITDLQWEYGAARGTSVTVRFIPRGAGPEAQERFAALIDALRTAMERQF